MPGLDVQFNGTCLDLICCALVQTTLKALFPAAAGRKHEERVIPQLPSEFPQPYMNEM